MEYLYKELNNFIMVNNYYHKEEMLDSLLSWDHSLILDTIDIDK